MNYYFLFYHTVHFDSSSDCESILNFLKFIQRLIYLVQIPIHFLLPHRDLENPHLCPQDKQDHPMELYLQSST